MSAEGFEVAAACLPDLSVVCVSQKAQDVPRCVGIEQSRPQLRPEDCSTFCLTLRSCIPVSDALRFIVTL